MTAQQSLDIVILLDLVQHLQDDKFCSKNIYFSLDSDNIKYDKEGDCIFLNIRSQQIPGIVFGRMINALIPSHIWIGKMDLGIVLHDEYIGLTCSFFGFGAYQPIHAKLKDGYQYDLILHSDGSRTTLEYAVSLHDHDYKNKLLLFLKRLINIAQQYSPTI